jgi:Flp pilus assembly protein TadG
MSKHPEECTIAVFRNERGLRARLVSLCRTQDAIAAIEFAFVMPVFLILLIGVVDFGMALVDDYRLDQAVAAGAEYAAVNAGDVNSTSGATLASDIATAVEDANGTASANDVVVVNDGPTETITSGTGTASGTASNANNCYCPTGSPPNWTWGSSATCGSSCTGGGLAGKFVTITATAAYTPLIGFYNLIGTSTLQQSAVVETQ